ncbi:MAG: hypothetical protein HC819_01980 [Cyclobacteriaceae bacterium]|nr:hypothetical protein [Cyclobacteriaceae bacterium]
MKNSLVHRFLHNRLNREALKALRELVQNNEAEVLKYIEQDWQQFEPNGALTWSEKHWQELEAKMKPAKNKVKVLHSHWWIKVAATVLIVTGVWFAFRPDHQSLPVQDGSPAMITKVNDNDQPAIVMLKDGTRVTLAAHSTLSYYENFNAKYRVVHLEGEAAFETDQQNTRPFVVVSDNITSICRGREFSISAFKESNEINVTLASGQIEIAQNDRMNSESNKVAVKSCERFSFNKAKQQYLIGQITDCEYHDKVQSMKDKATPQIVML